MKNLPKQDRAGVRKAMDIERKYNLGDNDTVDFRKQLTKISRELEEYKISIDERLKVIETAITPVYEVIFYDEQKEVIAYYSIAKGNVIASSPQSAMWEDSEGNEIVFPYMPTQNIELYIRSESVS